MDFADDLGGYDAKDVRLACRLWRQSPARSMPTPGQLMQQADKYRVAPLALTACEPPRVSPEERQRVGAMMRELAAELAQRHAAINFLESQGRFDVIYRKQMVGGTEAYRQELEAVWQSAIGHHASSKPRQGVPSVGDAMADGFGDGSWLTL